MRGQSWISGAPRRVFVVAGAGGGRAGARAMHQRVGRVVEIGALAQRVHRVAQPQRGRTAQRVDRLAPLLGERGRQGEGFAYIKQHRRQPPRRGLITRSRWHRVAPVGAVPSASIPAFEASPCFRSAVEFWDAVLLIGLLIDLTVLLDRRRFWHFSDLGRCSDLSPPSGPMRTLRRHTAPGPNWNLSGRKPDRR